MNENLREEIISSNIEDINTEEVTTFEDIRDTDIKRNDESYERDNESARNIDEPETLIDNINFLNKWPELKIYYEFKSSNLNKLKLLCRQCSKDICGGVNKKHNFIRHLEKVHKVEPDLLKRKCSEIELGKDGEYSLDCYISVTKNGKDEPASLKRKYSQIMKVETDEQVMYETRNIDTKMNNESLILHRNSLGDDRPARNIYVPQILMNNINFLNKWPELKMYYEYKSSNLDKLKLLCRQCGKDICGGVNKRHNFIRHLVTVHKIKRASIERKPTEFVLKKNDEYSLNNYITLTKSTKIEEVETEEVVIYQTPEDIQNTDIEPNDESFNSYQNSQPSIQLYNESEINNCLNRWPELKKYYEFKSLKFKNMKLVCKRCRKDICGLMNKKSNFVRHLRTVHKLTLDSSISNSSEIEDVETEEVVVYQTQENIYDIDIKPNDECFDSYPSSIHWSDDESTKNILIPEIYTYDIDFLNKWPELKKYYEFKSLNLNKVKLTCKQCSRDICGFIDKRYNFTRHLKKVHKFKLPSLNESSEIEMENYEKYSSNDYFKYTENATIDEYIINFVIDTASPYSVVENRFFKGILALTREPVEIENVKILTDKINDKFDEHVKIIKEILNNILFIAVTVDCWTSFKKSYVGMTVHWIDPESMKRKMCVLGCTCRIGRVTYAEIEKIILEKLQEYCITEKTVSITTDNGSNFVESYRLFAEQDKYQKKGENTFVEILYPEIKEEHLHLSPCLPKPFRCAAHTLNLISTSFVKRLAETNNPANTEFYELWTHAIQKCRVIWSKQDQYIQLADQIWETTDCNLMEFPTENRWNSYYEAIKCLTDIDYEKLILVCEKLDVTKFSMLEVNFLKEYIIVMDPVAAALNIVESETCSHLGMLMPIIEKMLALLEEIKCVLCEPLREHLISQTKIKFKNILESENHLISTLLHPYHLFLLMHTNKFTSSSCKEIFMKLANERLVKECPLISSPGTTSHTNNGASVHSRKLREHEKESPSIVHEDSINVLGQLFDKKLLTSQQSRHDCKFLQYINEIADNPINDLSFLNSYPCIKHLFLKYNTPLPSSAAVEHIFTIGNDIVEQPKTRLLDSNFEKCLVLKVGINSY